MFDYEWQCMWDHVDPAKRAYFPELVNACHKAGDAFMQHIDWPYWDNPEKEFHLPIVESHYEFKRPVKAGDFLTISVEPELGTSSARLEFTARNEDGDVVLTGYEQHVCVDDDTDQSTPLPEEFRAAVNDFLEQASS